MESYEELINNQKDIIKKLSEIKLVEDKTVFEIVKKYLQINNENKAGIVSLWLEQKKQKFKDCILNKIIIDTNLPIYYDNSIFGEKVNYSLEILNTFDSVYSSSKEEWIKINMNLFLNAVLDEKSSIRQKNGEKVFFQFFNKTYENNLIIAFIKKFSPMINNILKVKINNSDTRVISLGFIRRITDCIYNRDISGLSTYAYFNKRISIVFSNSRRLIRNLFAFEFIKNLEIFKISNIPHGEFEKENDTFEYNYNDNKIIITFKPKKTGINYGFILYILKKKQSNQEEYILNSFYVKKYHGSTKVDSKNFEEKNSDTFFSSSLISFKASLSSIEKKVNGK